MPLVFKKEDRLKANTSNEFVGKDGIYKVLIIENAIKVDDWEDGTKKDWKYHNLKVLFDNGRTKYIKIYYENAENDIVPAGYNFLLSLRNILLAEYDAIGKDTTKVLNANANQILGTFIKNKMSIYLAFRQNKFKDNIYFNMNQFVNPMGTIQEAEEEAEKRKLEIIDLVEKVKEEAIDDWDEDDL